MIYDVMDSKTPRRSEPPWTCSRLGKCPRLKLARVVELVSCIGGSPTAYGPEVTPFFRERSAITEPLRVTLHELRKPQRTFTASDPPDTHRDGASLEQLVRSWARRMPGAAQS